MPEMKNKEKNKKIFLPIFEFKTGKKIKQISLPKKLQIDVSPFLIHQVLIVYLNSKRKPAHTKTRSEVRGGGAKPWRQKGTGRARHGSIRSPIWRGGGVVFGPRKDDVSFKKINKKMKKKALLFALKNKAENSKLIIFNNYDVEDLKTKTANNKLKKFPFKKITLLVFAKEEKNKMRPFRNLNNFKTILTENLNLYDILASRFIVFSEKSFDNFKK